MITQDNNPIPEQQSFSTEDILWALIGGLGTNAQVGASAFVTHVSTQDFALRTAGASVDVDNRVEISAARQRFDAGTSDFGDCGEALSFCGITAELISAEEPSFDALAFR